jgi:RES domain-containing protein
MAMVYTAEHPALAALEILNGWQHYSDLSGYSFYLCRIDPDTVENSLPDLKNRGIDPRDVTSTRVYGDEWVTSRRSVVLRVPSVAAPASYNFLLNPDHPEFEEAVARELLGPFQYDEGVGELIRSAKDAVAKEHR